MSLSSNEVSRKIIHLTSLFYPFLYLILTQKAMLIVVGTLFCILLVLDFLRTKFAKLNNLFCKYFNFALRKAEAHHFSGATYFMLGVFLTILLFSKEISIVALCVLSISDTFASIIGLRFGKIKIIKHTKSVEGTAAFFISAVVISCIGSNVFMLSITGLLLACVVTTFLEMLSKVLKLDDNILIPISFAGFYTLFACPLGL